MTSSYTLSLRLSQKEFVYRTGVTFRGLTISQTEKGFNVVIRGLKAGDVAVYSMTQHTDPVVALEILVDSLGNKNGERLWRPDRFYKGNGQR